MIGPLMFKLQDLDGELKKAVKWVKKLQEKITGEI